MLIGSLSQEELDGIPEVPPLRASPGGVAAGSDPGNGPQSGVGDSQPCARPDTLENSSLLIPTRHWFL